MTRVITSGFEYIYRQNYTKSLGEEKQFRDRNQRQY